MSGDDMNKVVSNLREGGYKSAARQLEVSWETDTLDDGDVLVDGHSKLYFDSGKVRELGTGKLVADRWQIHKAKPTKRGAPRKPKHMVLRNFSVRLMEGEIAQLERMGKKTGHSARELARSIIRARLELEER